MVHFDSTENGCVVRQTSEQRMTEADSVLADSIHDALAKEFSSVPQVQYVLTEAVPNALLVWIAVDNPEPGIRRRIYDKELGLISEFPEIDFDFNLVTSMGRPSAEIASSSELIYSRSE